MPRFSGLEPRAGREPMSVERDSESGGRFVRGYVLGFGLVLYSIMSRYSFLQKEVYDEVNGDVTCV
jgi:hypothetical protein